MATKSYNVEKVRYLLFTFYVIVFVCKARVDTFVVASKNAYANHYNKHMIKFQRNMQIGLYVIWELKCINWAYDERVMWGGDALRAPLTMWMPTYVLLSRIIYAMRRLAEKAIREMSHTLFIKQIDAVFLLYRLRIFL